MNSRELAIVAVQRVKATDAYLNIVVDSLLDEYPLADERDASLATELSYGTVRRQRFLDAAIAQVSARGLDTLEDAVLATLRVGAYQLFFTRIPKHAAVDATVETLKDKQLGRASGFVNAILRKLSAMEPSDVVLPGDALAQLALKESHPEWLVRRWVRHFGQARTEAMLAANNSPPPVTLRVNTTKATRDDVLKAFSDMGVPAKATLTSPVGITLDRPGKLDGLYGFAEGLWQVQDEAAQLVGIFASVSAGAQVADLCAAPGGKTCHLLETCTVTASDLRKNKLPKIVAEAERLGLSSRLTVQAADASVPLPGTFGEFDAVFVDAPCSGLGTLRRHPELRYKRLEEDMGRLAKLQRSILAIAHTHVKPGGLLVYSVCTTEPEEGADQVEMFLRTHPDFTAEPPPSKLGLPLWQGHLRTLPGPEGHDGFFAARLRRMY